MHFSSSPQKQVSDHKAYEVFSTEFDYNSSFLESPSELISYTGIISTFITDKNIHQLNTNLIDNAMLFGGLTFTSLLPKKDHIIRRQNKRSKGI